MFANAAIVLFAGLAAAQRHAPVGEPSGNPITRPLNEIVPKCEPFTITWTPTTANTVSVLLLKGPSTNVVKFGPSLAEGIVNGGSLSWTPAADLPVTADNTGYGLQIIDDVTGQYQYSTQFGISAGKCGDVKSSSSVVVPASSAPASYPVASSPAGYPAASTPPSYPVASATPPAVTSAYPTQAPYPTTMVSAPAQNATVKPSGAPMSNTTRPALPEQTTNAASGLSAGLGLVGAAAAVAAFML